MRNVIPALLLAIAAILSLCGILANVVRAEVLIVSSAHPCPHLCNGDCRGDCGPGCGCQKNTGTEIVGVLIPTRAAKHSAPTYTATECRIVNGQRVCGQQPAAKGKTGQEVIQGHWERRGLFGRQVVWVDDAPQAVCTGRGCR